jgi:outer membrane receptor protein involved in Fe transport
MRKSNAFLAKYTACSNEWPGASAIVSSVQRRVVPVLLLYVLLSLGVGTLLAQTPGKISGRITDSENGEPLVGVNVLVLGTKLGAATDVDGTYFILNVTPGQYDIEASLIGYRKVLERDVIVNSGKTTTIDFKLQSEAVLQKDVVIEATRPDVEREKTSTSAVIRSDEVQQIAGIRDVGDVIGLVADVTDGHFRGGRQGEELYTLQGVGIMNPIYNTDWINPTALLPIMSAVEEVEVITSGFGAQYGNAQSGVVNITMKEGRSDKWRSHAEVRTRAPGRRYFGANVFDPNANPYLQTLLKESSWFAPSSEEAGQGYWTTMGQTLRNEFGLDTTVQIAVARALWQESRRLLNNNSNDKNIDYSQEISTGGPVGDNVRMFFALRNNTEWPAIPTEHPNVQQQIMGNIAADVASGSTLRISGAYAQSNTNYFPSENSATSPGFFRWLWDNIMSIEYIHSTNSQIGLRYDHAIDPQTFYEIKLNALVTMNTRGATPFPANIPDSLLGKIDWSKVMAQPVTAPDGFTVGSGDNDFYDDETQTYSLDASLTSQVTKSHLLNAGVQSNLYVINVNDHTSVSNTLPLYNVYDLKPFEASLYVQDKMEFQGMIANVGLRWDLWDENVRYNPDLYAPYRILVDSTYEYQKSAMNVKAPIVGRLQPRVGISFPVSVETVFHLNYGSFMQRPSFQYILNEQAYPPSATGSPLKASTLGNPTLRPQVTNSYDVGVMQGLGEGFTLDVSGYYKDVKDLIQAATYAAANGTNSYTTYINRDYADIRGFRVILTKRRGDLTGSVNYQYSVATGKSSAVGSMTPTFVENQPPNLTNTSLKDILLDFDRTHNVIINLSYLTNEDWGIRIGSFYPFADLSVSAISSIRSGRPYSYYNAIGVVDVNNERTPMEYNTNLRISRRIRDFFGAEALVYLEVFNLFNNKVLNYQYLFQSDVSGQLNPNAATATNAIRTGDYHDLIYQNDKHPSNTFLGVDKSFLVYSNQPRSFNLGIAVDF